MSGDGIVSDEFASIAGPGVEGTLMTFAPDPRKNPNAQGARREVPRRRASSRKPTRSTATRRCRSSPRRPRRPASTDPQEGRRGDASGKGPFKTVIGDISFDKKGDITRPDYVMYVWKKGADGKITYVQKM